MFYVNHLLNGTSHLKKTFMASYFQFTVEHQTLKCNANRYVVPFLLLFTLLKRIFPYILSNHPLLMGLMICLGRNDKNTCISNACLYYSANYIATIMYISFDLILNCLRIKKYILFYSFIEAFSDIKTNFRDHFKVILILFMIK